MKAAVVLLLSFSVFSLTVPGQVRHPGILLYEQAKYYEAIRSLSSASKSKEHKRDAEIWNYLGLAYFADGAIKKSVKALEKAVDLAPTNSLFRGNLAYAYLINQQSRNARGQALKAAESDPRNAMAYRVLATIHLREQKLELAARDTDTFISNDPTNPHAYILKAEVLLAQLSQRIMKGSKIRDETELLRKAMEVLESGIPQTKGSREFEALEREFEAISYFYKHFTREPSVGTTGAGPQPGVTPYRILSKRPAQYTDEARTAGVEGAIRVAVVLGSDGTVSHTLFLTRLGHGLEDQVRRAVREIRFEPKRVDGKPVPVVVTLEYTFDIY